MKNNFFNENGYLVLTDLVSNIKEMRQLPPLDEDNNKLEGGLLFDRNGCHEYHDKLPKTLTRLDFPAYKGLHQQVKLYLEDILDMYLLKTYTCDRFYYEGSDMYAHTDRDACEISVTLQIGNSENKKWPIWLKLSEYEEVKITLNDGDAIVYKGRDILHWRDELTDCSYHHQLFLHYVDSQGDFVQHGRF